MALIDRLKLTFTEIGNRIYALSSQTKFTKVILNVPAGAGNAATGGGVLDYSQTVVDTRVTSASLIMLNLGSMVDGDENDAELLDVQSLAARPANGAFDIIITFSSPTSGAIPVIYRVG
jgi:hypothetical protein